MTHNGIINIERLRRLGYKVEHLGDEWPLAHSGEYRWLNERCGSLQHHDARTFSEYDAWADADRHARENQRLAA